MLLRNTILMVAAIMPAATLSAYAQAPATDAARQGAEVYQAHCAVCHDHPQGSIPPHGALHIRTADYVYRVLAAGAMRQQAFGLTEDQLKALVIYVTGHRPGEAPSVDPEANRCQQPMEPMTLQGSSWNGWSGQGMSNERYQPNPGLNASDVPRLKLRWAFALPGGAAGGTAQPTIVGGRVFISSADGHLFALNATSGCTVWTADVGVQSRNPVTIAKLPSGGVVAYLGDDKGDVHALDADTGKELWRVRMDPHPATRITGSPAFFEGRLYVPVSSLEEAVAADPAYPCCSFRGSIAALDAVSGRLLWQSYTIRETAKTDPGNTSHSSPSGGAVWTSPAIDAKRRLVYVATGNAYTEPAAPGTDAVIAFDLDSGSQRWVHQVVANDVWVVGCDPKPNLGCPKGELGPDFDLGGSPILATTAAGKQVLIASSKSGVAWGFDVDHAGKILWQAQVAQGGTRGGVEWGGASDGKRIYFAISDSRDDVPFSTKQNATHPIPGGLSALDVATGKLLWHTPAPKAVCAWGTPCYAAQPGAAIVIPGVVFAGSWDGHERAYSAADGKILWDFDTAASFDGVNGAQVKGGSIDGGSQTVADGALFVNSGIRDHTGNALLSFTVDGK